MEVTEISRSLKPAEGGEKDNKRVAKVAKKKVLLENQPQRRPENPDRNAVCTLS
jgi:hypothetical protein